MALLLEQSGTECLGDKCGHGEDDCRIGKDYAPQSLSLLRQIVLNLLRQGKSTKVGIEAKRKKAG